MKILVVAVARIGLGVAAMLSAITGAQAQTLVHFGNFAPRHVDGGGSVSLFVNGSAMARDVAYGEWVPGLSLPAGVVNLALVDETGAVLTERDARLLIDIPHTVYASGNGVERNLEIRVVQESPRPLHGEDFVLQLYSAVIHPVDPLRYALQCGPSDFSGTLTFGREAVGRITARRTVNAGCTLVALVPGPQVALLALVDFDPIDGGLQRVVLLGDGDREPFRLQVFDDTEVVAAVVVPDQAMNGLWFDPRDDGSGLTLSVETANDGEQPWITGVFYGYGFDGERTWALIQGPANTPVQPGVLDGMRVVESVGGTVQGLRQPVRMSLGSASLDFHSCRDATLYLLAASDRMPQRLGREPGDGAEQLFRLRRVLPIDSCTAGVGQ